jgi:hypothetical protein
MATGFYFRLVRMYMSAKETVESGLNTLFRDCTVCAPKNVRHTKQWKAHSSCAADKIHFAYDHFVFKRPLVEAMILL